MAPPQAIPDSPLASKGTPAAVSFRVQTLKKRADFLRASRAARVVTQGFVLQMRMRKTGEAEGLRVGFTCSKKVGNAVARNRAKRRLRAIAHELLPHIGLEGADYVLVGRRDVTAALPYTQLIHDFRYAVQKLHGNAR